MYRMPVSMIRCLGGVCGFFCYRFNAHIISRCVAAVRSIEVLICVPRNSRGLCTEKGVRPNIFHISDGLRSADSVRSNGHVTSGAAALQHARTYYAKIRAR